MENPLKPVEPHKEIMRPDFPRYDCYDFRNVEDAGKYRGVGRAGKVGSRSSESIDAMPPSKEKKPVPRNRHD